MAVLDRENFMNRLKERVGEDTSDEAISFIEDMQDTFNDLETRSSGNNDEQWETKIEDLNKEWQTKYDENDNMWREKYRDRFFNSETTPDDVKEEQEEDVIDDGEETTFDDLFEEREG